MRTGLLLMGVRVRFAPSPTGLLHLGGARTALFNYLFATASRGQFVLRIEDTDQDRYVPGSVEKLEKSLQWLGIEFHESPSMGGLYGPYVQSERLTLYQQYSKHLLQNGSGYPCFCSKERLQSLRQQKQQTGYDGLCRSISTQQAEKKMSAGTPYTIRLKVPHDIVVKVDDMVYGEVEVSGSSIEDQVLLKTDGFPTYHLACVVDDHCMDISHVLRGEEWLLSTAKHLLLYSSLGWNPPVFAHLPLLLSSTGEKISKRQQSTAVQSYQEKGFLKEAVTEYLSQLHNGQSEYDDGDFGRETLEELAHGFSLSRINRNPVTVDEEKLTWINKKHFLRRLQKPSLCADLARELAECVKTTLKFNEDIDAFCQLVPYQNRVPPDSHTLTKEYLSQVLQVLQDRVSLVPQIPVSATYFWRAPIPNINTITSIDNAAIVLEAIRERLTLLGDFTESDLTSNLKGVSATLSVPHKVTMQLCRAAVIGQQTSPGVAGVFQVLGKDEVLDRLQRTITAITQHNL